MKRINRIADMSAEAEAARAVGLDYAQMQQLEAMRDAAKNEGGAAGMGMSMGAGLQFGQMMAGSMAGTPQQSRGNSAAPDPLEKLKKLKAMLDSDLISQVEYDEKKKEILSSM